MNRQNEEPNAARVGRGASPGRACGKAHVIRTAADALAMPSGSILVARIVHPHMAPLMAAAAGVLLEEGSLLQHATTLAREFGIPAIVGLRDATAVYTNGELLELDGSEGTVTRRGQLGK